MAKKKKFQAIKADVGNYKGIVHDGKEYRFGSNDTFTFSDEGLARELDSMYGKKGSQKLAITAYDDHTTRELGHKYTFQGVDMESRGGNERVKVRTADGFTFMSREKAEELELEIVEQKRIKRRVPNSRRKEWRTVQHNYS